MQTYTIKHITKVKHSVSEDVFIDMVRAERPLWDKKDRDYKNLELKAQLWNSIAEKCNTTEFECKRRWTGLREKYRREKIFNSKQRRLGQAVDFAQRWGSYEKMMFLDQVYTPRGSYHKNSSNNSMENSREAAERLQAMIKYEEDSSDECNVNDFVETNVDSHSDDMAVETSTPDIHPSSSSSILRLQENQMRASNGTRLANPFSNRLSAAHSENVPRIWVNSLPNLSIIPTKNLKDDDSSSQQSSNDVRNHSQIPENSQHVNYHQTSQLTNKYTSFGQYIADTLSEMDEKYANELHVHILQEIIKIKSKILQET